MPPKTIRRRSEEVDVKVSDVGITRERTELLLTSGLDIEFTVFVNCSDYYMHELSSKEYALGAYRNVDHFDYVDLYIDGEMVAENIKANEVGGSGNSVLLGVGSRAYGGSFDIDYVRWTTDGVYAPPGPGFVLYVK